MNSRHGLLSGRTRSVVAVALIAFLGIDSPSYAVSLPEVQAAVSEVPAVSPGGALPFRDEQPREPRGRGPALDAPSDEKRPTVPDSGIRMVVKEFILEGIVDHPERGILRSDLEGRVEAIRAEHPRGFTISELQQVTDEITHVYRSAGYILARAYIPEQKVTDGRVVIRILEGELEKLEFQGNDDYSNETLSAPFDGRVGEPVNREEIESSLLLLGDYPGLIFNSVFSPGDTMGTAKLGINVESEKTFEGVVWFDNHGSAHTGEYRLWADVAWNNVTGAADRLTGRVLSSAGDKDGKNAYYALGYQRPVFGARNILGIDISNNAYSVGGDFAELDLEGESSMLSASLRQSLVRGRDMNFEGRVALARKESSSDLSVFTIGTDTLMVLSLGAAGDYRDSTGFTQAALQYNMGLPGVLGAMDENGDNGSSSRSGGSGDQAGGDFSKINLTLARWQSFPSVQLLRNQTLLARVDVQSSSDLLVSMEQMSLGGPNSVRAYPPSEYMVDSGQFVSLEWIARAGAPAKGKVFEGLQVSAFYDYASGKLNDPKPNDIDSPSIQGYGVSAQLSPNKEYFVRLELATAVKDPKPSNDRNVQYFFKLGYRF